MAVDKEQLKQEILAYLAKAVKPALYIADLAKCNKDAKIREVKNAANELVKEEKVMFWSSGSSTMYALPERAKNEDKRGV